jgi:hypothetical protein
MKAGYVLRAYRYISGEDGNAVVYVMPSDSPFPEPEHCELASNAFLRPPVPEHADRAVMRYIEGPVSLRSYLLASVLARELLEFGARRHGCSWSLERILETAGPDLQGPTVELSGAEATVTFCTRTGQGRVVQYTDRYQAGAYTFHMDAIVVACGNQPRQATSAEA